MTQSSDERAAEMRELFFETSQELLQALNEQALELEKRPDDTETIRSIRRIVHTLKGDSAACGYRELSEVAHEFEDALASDVVSAHASLADVTFSAADLFAGMLAAYQKKGKQPSTEPLRKMISKLTATSRSKKGRAKKTSTPATLHSNWTEYEKLAMQKAHDQGKSVYHITAYIDPHCAMPIAARQLLINAVSTSGDLLATRPEAASAEAIQRLDVILSSEKSVEQVTARCQIPTIISKAEVQIVQNSAPKAPAKTEQQVVSVESAGAAETTSAAESEIAKGGLGANESILRVDAERIDSVMNLVGELIIGKSMFQQALNEFCKAHPKDASAARFGDAIAFQARVLNDLQRSVMKIRMVPVEQLFRRFPRMLRDVAKLCDKEVELAVSGENTDLDKSLLDALAEPLTHLMRNAVSH